MKYTGKHIKILGLIVILTLIFLFAFNVTYSYFSAIDRVTGNIVFSNLNVRFAYRSNNVDTVVNDTSLTIIPSASSGTISRGSTFNLALSDGTEISYLAFNSSSDSCASYIRYRINAYKVNDGVEDTSINYGQYFQFEGSLDVVREIRTVAGETNAIYYIKESVSANSRRVFASSITLLESAPVSILNSQLKLTITFEAVQSANKAFTVVFDDGWGYLNTWT